MAVNYFTILYWFCHTSTWISHRYTRIPHHESPSLLLPVPSLWVVSVHQPQASSIMHWTWTGDLFHIWYYTCFNAFELWCWRRLLWVPWTARRSNQSILKEISPEYSLEGLRLKFKLQYFGHLMQRTDSLEKTLMLGKIESRRTRGWQRINWLNGITDSMDMSFEQAPSVGDRLGSLACCIPWGHKELEQTEQLNWTEWWYKFLYIECLCSPQIHILRQPADYDDIWW